MKKAVLFCGMLATALSLNAQQRLVLYEEFSGENCGPCAQYNPGLWELLSANASDVILIKYQVPIPNSGPLYRQNTVDIDDRQAYYSVPFAPYGRIDGKQYGGGNVGGHTQIHLDGARFRPTFFDITVATPTVSAAGVLSADVTINTTRATSGTNLKLRAALVETLEFDLPPGLNSEVDFHNVVRKMYPSADGQAIVSNWTANQTETYTVTGEIPDYVDKRNDVLFLVVWIQEDGGSEAKSVLQAAKSDHIEIMLPLDIASDGIVLDKDLNCSPGEGIPTVTLKNTGTTPITSAKIYFKVDNGNWQEHAWTGNLAPNATTDVVLPAVSLVSSIEVIRVRDSVAMPNNQPDDNWANNLSGRAVENVITEIVRPLPVSSTFETSGENWDYWLPFAEADGEPIFFYGKAEGDLSGFYDNSRGALGYPNFSVPSGASGYLIFPVADIPAGPKAMDFYVAYAQRTAENDKLEIVYSEDCGENWTSVWEKSGSDLKTADPVGSNVIFTPQGNSDWRFESVDVSAIPAGNALVAFRATSDGGSYLFLDNVTFRVGEPNGIEDMVLENNFRIYPNPVQNDLILEIAMQQSIQADLRLVNILGQDVKTIVATLQAGQNKISVATADLAPGVYILRIQTEAGTLQKKFVKQ